MEDDGLVYRSTCLYYNIPLCQSHTINPERVIAYQKWLHSPESRLEEFFNQLAEERLTWSWYYDLKTEYVYGEK